ncbi:Non-specific serine/threonine protein kinase [Bertholletia excelsa]
MVKLRETSLFIFSLLPAIFSVQPTFSYEFIFNGFHPSDLSLYGIASIESRTLTLTNNTRFSIGRALYPFKIPTKDQNSSWVLPFSTSFIFSVSPYRHTLPGHGIVFLFVPHTGTEGATSAQNLGFLNRTNDGNSSNHVFGIEFDVFENEEYGDISANHVGIDVNSLTSVASHNAGYCSIYCYNRYYTDSDENSFKEVKLNNGRNYQVWIDYDGLNISVTMALAGKKRPRRPLLNASLDLSWVLKDEMFVGFTASTGQLVEAHRVLAWSFSNTNFSIGEALVTTNLPSYESPKSSVFRSKGFTAGLIVGIFLLIVGFSVFSLLLIRRNRRRGEMEEWELEYWPHRIDYKEIDRATGGFCEENVIGIGGNGKVYKGALAGVPQVAVKPISCKNNEGMREFLAEISSLGRLKHRNLVGLRGWGRKEKGSLILVYDYMENGSLDKRVFECGESEMLSWEDRIRILKDVASGILYLHEGWEAKVLHRDIKASNVLLDKEMNGRLGDFGLARIHGHGHAPSTTRVVGTVGYVAPEVVKMGRASTQTDVFGFGILILEVICGRRPIEEGKPNLVDWVWELMGRGELANALDERMRVKGGIDKEEVERVLQLGLLCASPDPKSRPSMRQVIGVLEGKVGETDGIETEDMDVYLLEKMKSKERWSKYAPGSSAGSHPTFEQMRQSISSSISLSWSDVILEGR